MNEERIGWFRIYFYYKDNVMTKVISMLGEEEKMSVHRTIKEDIESLTEQGLKPTNIGNLQVAYQPENPDYDLGIIKYKHY